MLKKKLKTIQKNKMHDLWLYLTINSKCMWFSDSPCLWSTFNSNIVTCLVQLIYIFVTDCCAIHCHKNITQKDKTTIKSIVFYVLYVSTEKNKPNMKKQKNKLTTCYAIKTKLWHQIVNHQWVSFLFLSGKNVGMLFRRGVDINSLFVAKKKV